MKIDVHQHHWSEQLVSALEGRQQLPFVRRERGLTVLFLAGERPYVIDLESEAAGSRAALLEQDGLDRALICLSSPLGIECLPREQSVPLIEAYLDGALAVQEPFGVWGAIALDRVEADDVDALLERGCVGLSLPAGALAGREAIRQLQDVLWRLEQRGAPLLVHPGPGLADGCARAAGEPSLADPLWWSAMTRYVSDMQAAWFAFLGAGRTEHPALRVIFTMLAGLAPLQFERLAARGGPASPFVDRQIFYESSSYAQWAVEALSGVVGSESLLYGSDRPVVEPEREVRNGLDWDLVDAGTRRALGGRELAVAQ